MKVIIGACTPSPFASTTTTTPETVKAAPAKVTPIEKEVGIDVNVFPNPSVNDFKMVVTTTGKERISVRVMDMTGRVFKTITMMPGEVLKFGSELKAGTYMVETRQGASVATRKVIKF
jgi:hypothetical protein